jgi:hypothetical protein
MTNKKLHNFYKKQVWDELQKAHERLSELKTQKKYSSRVKMPMSGKPRDWYEVPTDPLSLVVGQIDVLDKLVLEFDTMTNKKGKERT